MNIQFAIAFILAVGEIWYIGRITLGTALILLIQLIWDYLSWEFGSIEKLPGDMVDWNRYQDIFYSEKSLQLS